MCKYLKDLFCCCFQSKKNVTKRDKKRREKKRSPTYSRYGTNWETLIDVVPDMSVSQIEDSMISEEVIVSEDLYGDRNALMVDVLKDYEFDPYNDLIGTGGFGEVYKIKDKTTGELFAVKVMTIGYQNNEISKRRFAMFKNEVFVLRKTSHKNIIVLFKHFMITKLSLCFLIMEFATEGDLNKRLKSVYKQTNKPFPETEAKVYFAQIAKALNFVHSKGYIHGDLKLDNVLITKTKDGKEMIKVSDFGCARIAFRDDEGLINRKKAIGTITYMSPEQLRVYIANTLNRPDLTKGKARNYNPFRSDVWALGVCLFRLLFYEYPYKYDRKIPLESTQDMIQSMKKGPPMTSNIEKTLSNDCKDILKSLLEYYKNLRIDMSGVINHKWISDFESL